MGVVAARNVVHSALFLLLSLLAVAGLYVLLLTEFLALVQIFIYGGAIIIVLLFAIMLTRSREFPRITDNAQWPIAAVAALLFFGLLTFAFLVNRPEADERSRVAFTDLGQVSLHRLGAALRDCFPGPADCAGGGYRHCP